MGDPAEALHDEVRGMRRYALALTGNSIDADDLVQESLQRVLKVMRRGQKVENLRAYLFSILHNTWVDHCTRHANSMPHVPIDDGKLELPLPANQQASAEWRATVIAIGQLPIDQREVLLLVGLEGFSYQEAASTLAVPVGTVMSRLSRGREALRRLMDAEDDESRRRLR